MSKLMLNARRWYVAHFVGRNFVSLVIFSLVLPLSLSAASIKTWTGGSSGYWTNGGNWSGGAAPVNGDSLLFPASATRYTTTNNFTNLLVATISFDGSNFVHYGNAVTNAGDITLNNSAGTNIIRFNLTLNAAQMFDVNGGATANLTVNSNINLNGYDLTLDSGASGSIELGGAISGAGNLRKNSAGSLTLSGGVGNSYSGWFNVAAGTVLLNKTPNYNAINGALTNSGTVRHLQSYQIPTVPIVLLSGSLLDLNDKSDSIGSLTMTGASVDTGSGTLTLGGNLTNLASITISTINGNLGLSSTTRTFSVADGTATPDLRIYAAITGSGTAGIIKIGAGALRLYGTNTYLGVTTINEGTVYADSDAAFGSPGAGVEVNNNTYVYLNAVNIGNAPLTLNSSNSYPLYAAGACSWSGPVTVELPAQLWTTSSGATMIFSNAISGSGDLYLTGNGDFEFAGTNGNYYTGTTYVKCGELRLNKTGPGTNSIAIPGDLVIGANGTGTSNVVLQVYGTDEIANTSDITINTNGILNTSGHAETIGALTLNGGRVDTSTGTLTLGGDLTVNPPKRAVITGQLGLGSSTRIINVALTGDGASDLDIDAHISNGGFIKSGSGTMNLLNTSSYSSSTVISNGIVRAYTDTALGFTGASVIVHPGAQLFLLGASIGNKPLTLNSPGSVYGASLVGVGACQWGGRVTLNTNVEINCDTSMTFTNPIVGSGGVKLTGGIFEYAGCITNTYTGVTEVQCQMLRLNHTCGSSAKAINGELVIGNGPGSSNVVVLFDPYLIGDHSNITLFTNGVLDLRDNTQSVGYYGGTQPTLTMNGGRIDAGTGELIIYANVVINGSPFPSRLTGTNLSLSGMRTFNFVPNESMPSLEVLGNLTLGGLTTTGNGILHLYGTNSYTLPTILGQGPTYVHTSSPFGTVSNGTTLTNSSYLYLTGVDVISAPLTNNSIAPYVVYAVGTCSWSGPLILNNDTTLFAYNNGSLALSNGISGAGSLTLIGDTFKFAGSSANTYTGGTYAKSDLLLLNKTSGQNAVPGDCFIGGGTGVSNAVQFLAANQIPVTANLTLQTNGVLNGNGFSDVIGNLIFNGGRVDNSGGTFTLTSGASVTVNPTNVMAAINGTLGLTAGDHIFSIGSGSADPDLSLMASVTGAGNIIYTGSGSVEIWGGINTYTGLTTLGGPRLDLYSDTGLGSPAGGTVITNGYINLIGVDIGNEALTNNRPAGNCPLYANFACSWSGPIVLNQDTRLHAYDTLVLSNALSGPGGLRLTGSTFEFAGNVTNTYAGTTEVQCSLLRLNHASATGSANAIPTNMIVGGGSGSSNVVQYLANNQIAFSSALTFQTNGVLNMGGFSDIVGSLTFNGGRVDDTGVGKLTIYNGAGITVNPTNQTVRINCELGLNPGAHIVTVGSGGAAPTLQLNARVSGSGGLTYEGSGTTDLFGDNTYTGTTIINGGTLRADTDTSFGGTGAGTVCNGGQIMLMSVNIVAEPLTNNRPTISYLLVGSGPCSWAGPMVLNSNALLYSYDTLVLSNVISGPGGLQLDGATFELAGNVTNTYAGITRVRCDLLRLNHSSASANANAIPGDMIIGGAGGASNVVKHLASYQIANAATLTFYSNAVLNANGFSDTIGSLVFTGGRVDTLGGTLTLSGNLTANAFSRMVEINGALGLSTSNHLFTVSDGTASPDLNLNAVLSGSGGFTATGGGTIDLRGNNTYSGPTTLNGASVTLYTDTALGSTSGGTAINDGSLLSLQSVNVGNEALTNNCVSPACPLYAFGSSAWGGPVFLNTNLTVYSDDSLVFGNAIAGVGGLKLTGATVEFAGTNANTYAGATTVGSSFLRLNHAPGSNAIAGPLVVGLAGSVSNVVVWLQNSQVVDTVAVTLQTNAVLNLNNQGDVLDSLVFNGGRIDTGTGWVRPASSVTVYPTNVEAVINGRLLLAGVVPFSVGDGPATYDLRINASIEDRSAGYHGGFNLTSPGTVLLSASNSFTGAITIGAGTIYANQDWALGSGVAGTTVNDGAGLIVGSSANNIAEPLTLNGRGPGSNGALQVYGTCAFLSNVVLNTDCTINGWTGGANIISFSNAVSGSGGFTKMGPTTLRLAGSTDNTFAGDTILKFGTLLLAKSSSATAIRYGTLFIGDGQGGTDADIVRHEAANQIWVTVPIVITNSGWLDLNGFDDALGALTLNAAHVSTGSGLANLAGDVTATYSTNAVSTISGRVALSGTRRFTVENSPFSPDLNCLASVSGTGALTKLGSGSLGLSASNSYSGQTTVGGGLLYAYNSYALGSTNVGTLVSNGAVLVLSGNVQVGAEPLTLNGNGDGISGALTSIAGSNSFAGLITLGSDTHINVDAGDYLNLTGAIGGTGNLHKDDTGTLLFSGSDMNNYAGTTYVNAGTLGLAKTIINGAIPGALVVGDGLGGANADVVQLLNSSYGQIANTSALTVNSSGLLDLTSFGSALENVGSLAGSGRVNLAAAQLGVGLDGTSTLFSGTISGAGGSLAKSGAGIFTLTGTNTYTGETLAYGGVLLINGSQSASPVRIANSGILGGTGLAGAISGGLGTLAPGASPGTLTCSNLCLSNNTVLSIELTGTNSDQLNVRGTNNLGGATLQVTTAGLSPTEGQTFIILNNDGTDGIANTFAGLPEGGIVSAGSYQFAVSYIGGTGNDVTLTYTNTAIQVVSATITAGNGNGAVDANECDLLTVVLTNGSASALSGVTATLTPVTPGMAVTYPASAYPDIIPHGQGTNTQTFQFTTWPGFAAFCGSNVQLGLTLQSTSHGSFTLPVTLPSGSPGTPVTTGTSPSRNILDGQAITNTITIPAGTITTPLAKVTVSIYVTYGTDKDLDLYLIGPDGTMVELSTDNGSTGMDYGTSCSSKTTFDDSAAISITAGTAPFSGYYRPEGRLADFRGKTGAQVNGTWSLVVMDDTANGISGVLHCWDLTLYNSTCTDGGGACESCPDRVISGDLTSASATQTQRLSRNGIPSVCGSAKACPGPNPAVTNYQYDAYTFINGESNACVTVTLAAPGSLFSAAYLGSYTPTNLWLNYLADLGYIYGTGGGTNSYSFTVPAQTPFVVVVNEASAGAGCPYTLTVTGGSCRPVMKSSPGIGSNVVLDWTTAAVGYQLRQSLNVTNPLPIWSTAPVVPTVINSHFTATNNTTVFGPQRFYQLRKP